MNWMKLKNDLNSKIQIEDKKRTLKRKLEDRSLELSNSKKG